MITWKETGLLVSLFGLGATPKPNRVGPAEHSGSVPVVGASMCVGSDPIRSDL